MVRSEAKHYDFEDPTGKNEPTGEDGIKNNDRINDSNPGVNLNKENVANQNTPKYQDSRLKELKYTFSPEDELTELSDEMIFRAANPKNIGIFSSGGLSNKIVEKIQDKYSRSFKNYNFETTFKMFDRSIVPLKPSMTGSKEDDFSPDDEHQFQPPEIEKESIEPVPPEVDAMIEQPEIDSAEIEFEFEPDPGHELPETNQTETIDHPEPDYLLDADEGIEPEPEHSKPLTIRERAHQIFYELKKRLGLAKPREPIELIDEKEKLAPQEAIQSQEIEPEYMTKEQLPDDITAEAEDEYVIPEPEPPEVVLPPAQRDETTTVTKVLEDKDMLFIFTCLDDEFDIENALIMSELAKKNNILSIVIASLPRYFGKVENVYATNKILQRLRLIAEIVILIPYYETIDFKFIPKLIQELLDVIIQTGLINVDVADLKIVIKGGNVGIVTFGSGKHVTRHKDALFEALDSKLLNVELGGVQKALLNVTGSKNITLAEVEGLADQIKNRIANGARFILGTTIDPNMTDSLKIFILLGVTPMQVMVNKYATE